MARTYSISGCAPSPGPDRANNFDLLRVALAALVIYSHCYPLLGFGAQEPLAQMTGQRVGFGSLAVSGFFALSGYLIVQSWHASKSDWDFLRRRVRRIYPGFIVAAVAGTLLACAVTLPDPFHNGRRLLRALSTLPLLSPPAVPGTFPANPFPDAINGSLWTIRWEFCCYLGVLALGRISGQHLRWLAPLACLLLLTTFGWLEWQAGSRGLPPGSLALRLHTLAWLGSNFTLGMCLWLHPDRLRCTTGRAAVALGLLIAAASHPFAFSCTALICWPVLLFWFALHPRIRLHHFARRGDFSYGLYLYAFPVTQLVVLGTHGRITVPTLFLLVTTLTLPLAMASWYLVERPFLRRTPRLSPRGAPWIAVASPQPHP